MSLLDQIRKFVYKRGYRPNLGSILYSPSHEFIYSWPDLSQESTKENQKMEEPRLTEAEKAFYKQFSPFDATVRTVNIDHDGNVHVLLMWPKAYVESHDNLGLNKEHTGGKEE